MVFIHIQVAFHLYRQIAARMTSNLLQHVVEESQAGADVARAIAIEVEAYVNVCLLGGTAHFGGSFTGKEVFGDFVPIGGGQGAIGKERGGECLGGVLQIDGAATEIFGQLYICSTVWFSFAFSNSAL